MNKLIVFTDGACTNNGKLNAKAGCGVFYPNKEYANIAIKFNKLPITNQRAELYAIYLALINSKEEHINIYTDSLYSIKCLTEWMPKWKLNNMTNQNGKPIKNQDILLIIDQLLKDKVVTFNHVNSHMCKIYDINGHVDEHNINEFKFICNNNADKLANNGMKLV